MCVCERERESVCVCVRERESVCVCVFVIVSVEKSEVIGDSQKASMKKKEFLQPWDRLIERER